MEILGGSNNCSSFCCTFRFTDTPTHLIIALLGAISESPAPALYIPIAIHLHLFLNSTIDSHRHVV